MVCGASLTHDPVAATIGVAYTEISTCDIRQTVNDGELCIDITDAFLCKICMYVYGVCGCFKMSGFQTGRVCSSFTGSLAWLPSPVHIASLLWGFKYLGR